MFFLFSYFLIIFKHCLNMVMIIILLIFVSYFFICSCLTKHLKNDIPDLSNNNNKIYYCCYKKRKNYGMFLRASLGVHVCSSALIINGFIYRLKKDKIFMQKEPVTLDYLKTHYYILDTEYTTDILSKDWEKEILRKKRLNKDSLFKGFNCLKNCSCILNQLQGFQVKQHEIFTSIYVLRLILIKRWKINFIKK